MPCLRMVAACLLVSVHGDTTNHTCTAHMLHVTCVTHTPVDVRCHILRAVCLHHPVHVREVQPTCCDVCGKQYAATAPAAAGVEGLVHSQALALLHAAVQAAQRRAGPQLPECFVHKAHLQGGSTHPTRTQTDTAKSVVTGDMPLCLNGGVQLPNDIGGVVCILYVSSLVLTVWTAALLPCRKQCSKATGCHHAASSSFVNTAHGHSLCVFNKGLRKGQAMRRCTAHKLVRRLARV